MSKKKKDDAEVTTEDGEETPKKSKKKLLIMVVAPVLVIALAGYWFFLKPSGGKEEPKPGEVVTLEPLQVNLAQGHYLRVGVALQLVEGATEVDGSKALDATIELFSGHSVNDVSEVKERKELKGELEKELDHLYEGQVMGVYFTEFVTQ